MFSALGYPIVHSNVVIFFLTVIQFYSWVVLARVILTWFPNIPRDNPIVEFIHQITDPVLVPLRQMLPPMGPVDFSPLVLLIGLHVLRMMVASMSAGV